jgi:hypothetical protein
VAGTIQPLELAHLPYKKGTFEDYVGTRGLKKHGRKRWRRHVADVIARLTAALQPDEIVLGGGNVKKLKEPPPGARLGNNAKAFLGGFRLWKDAGNRRAHIRRKNEPAKRPVMSALGKGPGKNLKGPREKSRRPWTERPNLEKLSAKTINLVRRHDRP